MSTVPHSPSFESSSPAKSETSLSEPRGEENEPNTLDRYAKEFADLLSQHMPSQEETPSAWLARLPGEVFHYFHRGIATFGREAETAAERRGRLYLLHAALVMMWMNWGTETARKRFKSDAQKGTQRAAYLTTLEHYRRGGVVANYVVDDWFFQPVSEWRVDLISAAVRSSKLENQRRRKAISENTILRTSMETFRALRARNAICSRAALDLS